MRLQRILRFRALELTAAIVLGSLIGTAAALTAFDDDSPPTRVLKQVSPPISGRAISLLEAWDLGVEESATWGGVWNATAIRSVDVGDQPTATSGLDGRRFSWQMDFVDAETHLPRWVRITGGAVTDAIDPAAAAIGKGVPAARLARPEIDSTYAVAPAAAYRDGLAGSLGTKQTGVHFSIGDSPTGPTTIVVSGTFGGSPARIGVDASSGAVDSATRLVGTGGGLLLSDDGVSWRESSIHGRVLAVAADESVPGAPVYAVADSGDSVDIWRSDDGVSQWLRVSPLPSGLRPVTNALVVLPRSGSLSVVLLSTDGGIFSFDTLSREFATIPAAGKVSDIGSDDGQLLATVATEAGPTAQVLRPDGSWKSLPWAVGKSLAGGRPADAYTSGDAKFGLASVMGVARERDTMLVSTPGGVLRSADNGETWEHSLARPALLAIDDDGERLRAVAITVGSDDVVYSGDAGITWLRTETLSRRGYSGLDVVGHRFAILLQGGSQWVAY